MGRVEPAHLQDLVGRQVDLLGSDQEAFGHDLVDGLEAARVVVASLVPHGQEAHGADEVTGLLGHLSYGYLPRCLAQVGQPPGSDQRPSLASRTRRI